MYISLRRYNKRMKLPQTMNKKAILYFHQGWADIINQLSLITYYSKRYELLECIMRHDSHAITDFYVRDLENVNILYTPFDGGKDIFRSGSPFDMSLLTKPETDLLFHGIPDRYGMFGGKWPCGSDEVFFVKKFYECYGVDYITRVSDFDVPRDLELEEERYQDFINKHGNDYILYHDDEGRGLENNMSSLTILDKSKFSDYTTCNLNESTNIFFDYIKIIMNAKEIHLIDSVWGNMIWLLDAKYGLFKHIPIHVYCVRGHKPMFTDPVVLENWIIL